MHACALMNPFDAHFYTEKVWASGSPDDFNPTPFERNLQLCVASVQPLAVQPLRNYV